TFTQLSVAVPAVATQMYDVFLNWNSGTPILTLLAWTNDTTRATALTTQDGVLVRSGATTQLYLGSFRTISASQTEDSVVNRYLWNYYNRVSRVGYTNETADTWNYTTGTWRIANGNSANRVSIVVGVQEDLVKACVLGNAATTSGAAAGLIGIGVNITNGSNAFATNTTNSIT